MDTRTLHIDALDLRLGRLRRLPERAVWRMHRSLQGKGQLSPVAVVTHGEALVLVDGFVRRLAAQRLGWSQLTVEVLQAEPTQMKAWMYLRNRERGLHLAEQCRLVRELVEVDGQSQVEVADLLEHHKSWVCRRLGLARRLSNALLEQADLGRLTAGSMARLAELPARNQDELWAAGERAGLDGRAMGLLAELWRRAPDPDMRAQLLRHPAEAVAQVASQARRRSPAEATLAANLLWELRGLMRIARRLSRRLRPGQNGLSSQERSALAAELSRCRTETTAALRQLQELLGGSDGQA